MFKPMMSRSVEKMVHVIEDGEVKKGSKKGEFVLSVGEESVIFTANKVPAAGDAVIKQSEKDIYHVPAAVLSEKYYVDGAPEPVDGGDSSEELKEKDVVIEKLQAQVADLEDTISTLEEANDNIEKKLEIATTPLADLEPLEYVEGKEENLEYREAEAAAREGFAFTCKEWQGARVQAHVTYDKKKEQYMWNREGYVAKPLVVSDDDRRRETYYLIEVKK